MADENTDTKSEKDRIEQWLDKHFEPHFFSLKYVIMIPVFISFFGSIIMFIIGGIEAYNSALELFDGGLKESQIHMVLSVDAFLLGIVLVIFSYGIYDLFISNIDPADRPNVRPNWMKFKDIGELKITLAEVILIILTINFFELVLERMGSFGDPWQLMIIPIGLFFIALGIGVFKKLTQSKGPLLK